LLRRRELEEREKDDSVIDELAIIVWCILCVIGDVASIYRPSVVFWTNVLLTPVLDLFDSNLGSIWDLRTFLQFCKIEGLTCKLERT
jgi:hypothetical protein